MVEHDCWILRCLLKAGGSIAINGPIAANSGFADGLKRLMGEGLVRKGPEPANRTEITEESLMMLLHHNDLCGNS